MEAFTAKIADRASIPSRSDLGESSVAFESIPNRTNFAYGTNKEETQTTILLKRMIIGDMLPQETVVNSPLW